MSVVQALLVARKRHWIVTSVFLLWPHLPVTNSASPDHAPGDATKCPAPQMGFRATGRPRYNFQMKPSGASMYGGLYSYAKSFDEKIGWSRVGFALSIAII